MNAPIFGLTYGFTFAVLSIGFGVTFGFGAFQALQDTSSILYEDFGFLIIVFLAVVFGALVAGQASVFVPDYVRAKLSAKRIFSLLDKESEIDGYSEEGEKLVSILGYGQALQLLLPLL